VQVLDLQKLTLPEYSFITGEGGGVPGPGSTKVLLHILANTPALKALLVQYEQLHCSGLAAVW